MPLANKPQLPSPPWPIKIKENFLHEPVNRCISKTNIDEVDWFNDYFYSDMFALDFDCFFQLLTQKGFSHFVIDTFDW